MMTEIPCDLDVWSFDLESYPHDAQHVIKLLTTPINYPAAIGPPVKPNIALPLYAHLLHLGGRGMIT